MASARLTHRILFALSVIGVMSTILGVSLGAGSAQRVASASPASRPDGILGIGERTVPPVEVVPASEKLVVSDEWTVLETTASVRAAAPIPKPVVRRPAVRSAAASSRGSAPVAGGGWQVARASWYGPGFYGRRTASGAVLTQGMMNVAHKSLPFGTRIEFEFNGRSCVAVVNDRGPFIAGRVFDLGPGTAAALGFGGVHNVRYRILGR